MCVSIIWTRPRILCHGEIGRLFADPQNSTELTTYAVGHVGRSHCTTAALNSRVYAVTPAITSTRSASTTGLVISYPR